MEDLTSVSTTIDTEAGPSAAGAGQMPLTEAAPKNPTAREDLEAVFKNDDRRAAEAEKKVDAAKEDAKTDAKPAENATEKPAEAKAQEKPANDKPKADASTETVETDHEGNPKGEDGKEAERAEQQRRHVPPPKTFLPRAQELWRNTPREVQTEVERVLKDVDTEVQTLRQRTERYESLREFDELAKNNGRDLRESLVKINQLENLLQRNPVAGLNQILMEIGPRKADGQAISLFELATHVVNQGQHAYHATMTQAAQQQAAEQPNREAEAMRRQMAQMQEQLISTTVIEPFAREHPRYSELQEPIALILKSGMVPSSLSPLDKLAAAYDMAERLNPPSNVSPIRTESGPEQPPARRADDDFSGSKSIRSTPGAVSDDDADDYADKGEDIRDSIMKAGQRLRRA